MPISGTAPFTVTFTDASSSDVTAWAWDFGDGTSAATQNATHTYTVAGTYTVTLNVTSPSGTVQFSDVVTINGTYVPYTPPSPAFAMYGGAGGVDPQVMLRISNDGGKTWISEQFRSAGKSGEYWRRVRWNRLGLATRRVFEISVSDPIAWRLVGANIDAEPEA